MNIEPRYIGDILPELIKTISEKKKHPYYDRTCELARDYKTIITNEDTDYLFQKVITEDGEWYEQRKRLTNLILMPVADTVLKPNFRVSRSNDLMKHIKYENDKSGNRVKEFEDVLNKFKGHISLDKYARDRFIRLTDIDPNAWIVIEWEQVDKPTTNKVQPYPFEVKASQAINFMYDKNVLQWLIVDIDKGESLHKYTIYGKDRTIVMDGISRKRAEEIGVIFPGDGIVTEWADNLFIRINNDQFYIIYEPIPHNLGRVPAFCAGYRPDEYTDELTYINTFHKALPFLMDSVKAKSEKDLTFALHTFPIRIQYERACTNPECNNGVLRESGKTCPQCKGTGTLITTSTQSVITFPMPQDKDSFFPLDQVMSWQRPPTDIIDLMLKNIEQIKYDCYQTVWGGDSYSRQQIADVTTAYEQALKEGTKQDMLYPLAEHVCNFWTFAANIIADVTSSSNGLSCVMSIGKEFSVKSKEELSAEFDYQKKSGMSQDVYGQTEREIVRTMYGNQPELIRKYEIRKLFMPFNDKNETEIQTIIVSNLAKKSDIILWANYDTIWDQLERENEDIYLMPINTISRLLDAKVEDIMAEIQAEKPKTTGFNTGKPDSAPPEEEEETDDEETPDAE